MAGFTAFTWFHTILSLVELVAGLVLVIELLGSRMSAFWAVTFYASAVVTSVTGFGFDAPFQTSHVFGILTLIAVGAALLGHYVFHLAGPWRRIYAIGVVFALYLDVFVAIVQAFRKIPFLHALAPTESEAPFAIAQIAALLIFAWLIYATSRNFRPGTRAVAAH